MLCDIRRNPTDDWNAELNWIMSKAKGKSMASVILRLTWRCFCVPGVEREEQQDFQAAGF